MGRIRDGRPVHVRAVLARPGRAQLEQVAQGKRHEADSQQRNGDRLAGLIEEMRRLEGERFLSIAVTKSVYRLSVRDVIQNRLPERRAPGRVTQG